MTAFWISRFFHFKVGIPAFTISLGCGDPALSKHKVILFPTYLANQQIIFPYRILSGTKRSAPEHNLIFLKPVIILWCKHVLVQNQLTVQYNWILTSNFRNFITVVNCGFKSDVIHGQACKRSRRQPSSKLTPAVFFPWWSCLPATVKSDCLRWGGGSTDSAAPSVWLFPLSMMGIIT